MPPTPKEQYTSLRSSVTFVLLLFGPAVGGAIIGGILAGPAAANWGFWVGLAAGAVVCALLLSFKVLKPLPQPKPTASGKARVPKGGCSLLLGSLAFAVGGYLLGRAHGGTELAVGGACIGLILSIAGGFFLVSLIRYLLKPASDEAVFAAVDVVVFRLFFGWLWLLSSLQILIPKTKHSKESGKAFRASERLSTRVRTICRSYSGHSSPRELRSDW
jgi:hypothetical protein